MIEESEKWQRNKWWLFDRVVESPHRTSFYVRQARAKTAVTNPQEIAQFWSVIEVSDIRSLIEGTRTGTI